MVKGFFASPMDLCLKILKIHSCAYFMFQLPIVTFTDSSNLFAPSLPFFFNFSSTSLVFLEIRDAKVFVLEIRDGMFMLNQENMSNIFQ